MLTEHFDKWHVCKEAGNITNLQYRNTQLPYLDLLLLPLGTGDKQEGTQGKSRQTELGKAIGNANQVQIQ